MSPRQAAFALFLLANFDVVRAQRPEPGAVKPDPAFAPIEDVARLPRVLIIGDSISIGYTAPLRELLKGRANVHRIPANGAATIHGLQSIDQWLGSSQWDVIHFNWGLHDLKLMTEGKHQVELDEYARNLESLIARLKKTGAKLIWASTTPVPSGKLNPARNSADVPVYNAAAAEIMTREGVAIDDLYTAIFPHVSDLQMLENVHFKPVGYRYLAERVAQSVGSALQADQQATGAK